ncbi:site-specific integrase, partial [Candidatus Sumerlaeota bacterium]|nr:site-specific integrase [Candidatus Sumerlaeota bacterium]
NFLRFTRDMLLDRIDTALLDRYQRKRLAEVSQKTVRMEMNYVLRLLWLRGFQVVRPLPRPGRVTQQRAFTHDELERFFRACPLRYRTLYALMLTTGAREAELVPSAKSSHVALLKSEVDLGRRMITIRTAKAKPGAPVRSRVLPVPDDLVEPLRIQMASVEGSHVFRHYASSRRDFEAILRRAGITKKDELGRKVTSHSFRHTYATLIAEATGNNPFLVKEALGHQQLSTTERYCHVAAPQVRLTLDLRGVTSGCNMAEAGGLGS